MEKINFKTPEFLLCEIPIKDGSHNDNRLWIYHTKTLSLIEFVCVTDVDDFQFYGKIDRFEYFNGELIEDWFGVFAQNNCDQFESFNEDHVIKSAWNFLHDYLIWEDDQM